MASAIFDIHAFVKRLTGAGMPEHEALILAEGQARLKGEQLATNGHLRELEQRLKDRLTIRLGGMLAVAAAVVATFVRLL